MKISFYQCDWRGCQIDNWFPLETNKKTIKNSDAVNSRKFLSFKNNKKFHVYMGSLGFND